MGEGLGINLLLVHKETSSKRGALDHRAAVGKDVEKRGLRRARGGVVRSEAKQKSSSSWWSQAHFSGSSRTHDGDE